MSYPYIAQYIDSRGKPRIVFRPPQALKARGARKCTLPGPIGSAEFQKAYAAAIASVPERPPPPDPRTIAGLVMRYLASPTYKALAEETRWRYQYELGKFARACGHRPAKTMPAHAMAKILSEIENPFARRHCLKAARTLFAWAVNQHMRPDNPTAGLRVPAVKSEGFHTWTDEEVDQYRAFHALGTLPRLAMELAYETAARRGDCCLLGPAHLRNGRLEFRQKKTGGPVSIPVSPELKAAIAGYKLARHATFLQTTKGEIRGGRVLSRQFKAWTRAARLPEACTMHGLRKAQLRFSAECGATEHELMAQGGHASLAEVQRYTRMANRALMADSLAAKKRAVLNGRGARVVRFPKAARARS